MPVCWASCTPIRRLVETPAYSTAPLAVCATSDASSAASESVAVVAVTGCHVFQSVVVNVSVVWLPGWSPSVSTATAALSLATVTVVVADGMNDSLTA